MRVISGVKIGTKIVGLEAVSYVSKKREKERKIGIFVIF